MDESWSGTGPQIIEVEDVRALRIGLVAGRVDVVGRDEPGARVEVHRVDGRPLEVTLDAGELRVGYGFTLGGWEGWLERVRNLQAKEGADVHVAVQRDVAVRLGTVSAEGLLADVTHDATVATVSGSLVTDGTRGTLVAKSVSGDLVLRDHVGDLRGNAVSGAVTASGAFGHASVSTVSGAVAVDAVDLAGADVQTVSGDVTFRVPEGLGLTVAARTVSGRVVVDGVERRGDGPLRGLVDAVTGDGVHHVRATTVSGHVTVLRSATTPPGVA